MDFGYMQNHSLYHHFEQLIELPPSNHQAYISQHIQCPKQQDELKQLLAYHYESQAKTEWHDLIANQIQEVTGDQHIDDLLGTTLGPYKLVREIGKGGMGVVFLAERVDGTMDQQVAIKFLYPSVVHLVGSDVGYNQAQILAKLNHPNITSVLDAGKTATGLYYVVMEYVKGVPIDKFCQQNQLSFSERLALFLKVCDAISKTHVINIAHTDIKPSNVLVSNDGLVKVLDFDIAKTTDLPNAATRNGSAVKRYLRALSVNFASPEQLKGDDITLATDQYSLAVLLYFLLTESVPFIRKAESNKQERIDVIVEAIYKGNKQPLLLNKKVLQLTKLEQYFYQSDLNQILNKAMHPDAEQRYESVQAFKSDIHRALEKHAITAQKNNPFTRLTKWLYRKPAFAALYFILLASGGVLAYQNIALEQERNKAILAQQLANNEAESATELVGIFKQLIASTDPRTSGVFDRKNIAVLNQLHANIIHNNTIKTQDYHQLISQLANSFYSLNEYQKAIDLYLLILTQPDYVEQHLYEAVIGARQLFESYIILEKDAEREEAWQQLQTIHQSGNASEAFMLFNEFSYSLKVGYSPARMKYRTNKLALLSSKKYQNLMANDIRLALELEVITQHHNWGVVEVMEPTAESARRKAKNILSVVDDILSRLPRTHPYYTSMIENKKMALSIFGKELSLTEEYLALYKDLKQVYGNNPLRTKSALSSLVMYMLQEFKVLDSIFYGKQFIDEYAPQLTIENYEAFDDVAYGLRISGEKEQSEAIYQQIFNLLKASLEIEDQYIHIYLAGHFYETSNLVALKSVVEHFNQLYPTQADIDEKLGRYTIHDIDFRIYNALFSSGSKAAINAAINLSKAEGVELLDLWTLPLLYFETGNYKQALASALYMKKAILDKEFGGYLYLEGTYFQHIGIVLAKTAAEVGDKTLAANTLQDLYTYKYHINPTDNDWLTEFEQIATHYDLPLETYSLDTEPQSYEKLLAVVKKMKNQAIASNPSTSFIDGANINYSK